jgi:hypothetical protein
MIVDAVRSGYFQARFDHKHNTVHFGGQVRSARCRALACCPLPAGQHAPGTAWRLPVQAAPQLPTPGLCRRLSLSGCAATLPPWPSG